MFSGHSVSGPTGKHLDDEATSSYIDGTLSPAEMAAARRHLATCPDCRRNLATLQQTVLLLKEMPQVAAPRSFVLREVDVMPRRSQRSPLFSFLRVATAAVAVLLAVVLGGDFFLRQSASVSYRERAMTISSESQPAVAPAATIVAAVLPSPTAPIVSQKSAALPSAVASPAPTQMVESTVLARPSLTPLTPTPGPLQAAAANPLGTAGPSTVDTGGVATRAETPIAAATKTPELSSEQPATTSMKMTDRRATQTADVAETATISARMTAAPSGMGGGEATTTDTPSPTSSPTETLVPTATAVSPTEMPAAPATVIAENVVPQTKVPPQAPALESGGTQPPPPAERPLSGPIEGVLPLFRLVEIALVLIVAALAALAFASRPRH
jgi:anti-sigma factor RsiW